MSLTATQRQFGNYSKIYNYFNTALFNGKLSDCLLIISSRNTKGVCGHYAPERWKDDKNSLDEINLTPYALKNLTDIEIAQTIVHEMCHKWQNDFGKSSRKGYHNKEWGDKMESIGLMPSNTGEPGGRKTGQQMDDYVIEGGLFQKAFNGMNEEIMIPIKYDFEESALKAPSKSKNKTKYTCVCGTNVWGKSGLNIECCECETAFEAA